MSASNIKKTSKKSSINKDDNDIKTDNDIINKNKGEISMSDIDNDTLNNKGEKIESNKNEKTVIKTSNIHSPYTNTSLLCPIMLSPTQMDNKMYLHLKLNLINKLEGKCYKNYGFINKIYSIEETSDGIIEAEDPTCSAKIIVRFICNLCLPVINKEIICKIDRMNKSLIGAINGPIKIIITTDKINKDNFFPDMNRNIRIKKNSEVVVPEMYVKIIVLSKSFSDYDKHILVIGFLQDIATEEEVRQYYPEFNKQMEILDDSVNIKD